MNFKYNLLNSDEQKIILHSFNNMKNQVAGGLFNIETINYEKAANFTVLVRIIKCVLM